MIGEDLTLEEAAEIFHYPPEVIRLEDQLFFNFRDRHSDKLHVTQVFESIGTGDLRHSSRRPSNWCNHVSLRQQCVIARLAGR